MERQHICPTCTSPVPAEGKLDYFAAGGGNPPAEDDAEGFYEETARLTCFLGALSSAGPLALRAHCESSGECETDWLQYITWLSEELTGEAHRRLLRLRRAASLWRARAGAATSEPHHHHHAEKKEAHR